MSIHRNLMTVCFAAVFALGLAACSSSSDDPPADDMTMVDPGPTKDEQIATLQAEIAALRTQLGIDADADVGDSITALQAELKRLKDEKQARMDAEQAAKDKELAAMARKLAVGLDATFPTLTAGSPAVTAKYGKMATVAGDATDGFFPAADTTNAEPMFMAKNSKSLGTMNGWSGTELMSSPKGGPTDVMRVYTNVDAGRQVAFAEWVASTAGVSFVSGSSSITILDAHNSYIAGAAFATGSGTKTHKANRDTDPSTAGLETFETSGTFGGASGTYSCTGECTSAVLGSDGGVDLTGTWTFTPSGSAMAKIADSNYQHFGWWLRKTNTDYLVHVFSGSMGGAVTDVTSVGGTATYTGPAAGKYSIYDSGPKGGHFTATVELKADFKDATTLGTISGTVDNFMGDTAGMDTWMVKLPELNLAATGSFAAADTADIQDDERPVWSVDGFDGAVGDGMWSGSLYSAAPAASDMAGTPLAAAGTFSAEHGDIGNMRGAFGASRSGP